MKHSENRYKSNNSGSDATDKDSRDAVSSSNSMGDTKDYISGDSTPSSSGHQFPWIATNPKHESKKSAMKTNS